MSTIEDDLPPDYKKKLKRMTHVYSFTKKKKNWQVHRLRLPCLSELRFFIVSKALGPSLNFFFFYLDIT
jgi:hypothetical protein